MLCQKKLNEELLSDFRANFIDTKNNFDMRDAFFAITEFFPIINDARLMEISQKAKFSKEGVSMEEGTKALYEIYQLAVASIEKQEDPKK